MAVHSVASSLSARRIAGGAAIARGDFIDRLAIAGDAPVDGLVCTGKDWAASRVDFRPVRAKDHPIDYVDVWMDQDQFELALAPKFVASCARLGLRIELISNDVSAGQARAWGAT